MNWFCKIFGQAFTAVIIDSKTKKVIDFKFMRAKNKEAAQMKSVTYIKKLIVKNKISENQKYELHVLNMEEIELMVENMQSNSI